MLPNGTVIKFDSKKEAEYYLYLKQLEQNGEIMCLWMGKHETRYGGGGQHSPIWSEGNANFADSQHLVNYEIYRLVG